jgi:hypothetical protein
LFFAVRENHVVGQKQRSTRDARIGDIERRPMVLPGVHQDKIDHVTKSHAISQIPKYAGQQQRASAENTIVIARRAKKVEQDGKRCRRGQHRKEPSPKRASFLQLAECYAAILCVSEIEKAADYGDVVETQASHGPGFARLVEKINAKRRDKVTDAPWNAGFQFSSIS